MRYAFINQFIYPSLKYNLPSVTVHCFIAVPVPFNKIISFCVVFLSPQHGKAALHLAGENGHEGVADVLLWHRAFVNAKSKLGVTPLHLAAENGYMKLVKVLIETHGASIDAMSLVSFSV